MIFVASEFQQGAVNLSTSGAVDFLETIVNITLWNGASLPEGHLLFFCRIHGADCLENPDS